jgi:hypothetical protein
MNLKSLILKEKVAITIKKRIIAQNVKYPGSSITAPQFRVISTQKSDITIASYNILCSKLTGILA